MTRSWILATATLIVLSGCKIDVMGSGSLTDLASKKTQPISVGVYSKNKGRACEVYLTVTDEAGQVLYSLQADPLEDAEFKIDTTHNDCNPDSPVAIVASGKDQVLGMEWLDRPSPVHPNTGYNGRGGLESAPRRMIETWYRKIVTHVQGEIRERATGRTIRTFAVTSEPRYERVADQVHP